MTTKRTETVRTTDVGQTFAVVGDIYRFLATGEDTSYEKRLGKPHMHTREEEGFVSRTLQLA